MAREINTLNAWLSNFTVATAGEATHFCYMGAKYAVPNEKHEECLRLYAQQLQRSKVHATTFLIERKTPVFRMHFDLDMIDTAAVSLTYVSELTRFFCGVMRTYYKEEQSPVLTCYILGAPIAYKPGGLLKSGFHLIWPYLLVDQTQALHLREGCVAAAKRHFGQRVAPANSFEDVVDETVLRKNGLRMVGSDKVGKCGSCMSNTLCGNCMGSKKARENRVYSPVVVLNERHQPDPRLLAQVLNEEDYWLRVQLCTVRSLARKPTTGFVVPAVAAIPTLENTKHGEASRARAATRRVLAQGDSEEVTSTKLCDMVLNNVLRCAADEWKYIELQKMFLLKRSHKYLVKVKGMGANFCKNVQRQHGSSTIYFMIDSVGLRQRCFCVKYDCKVFFGPYISLPLPLHMALFTPPSASLAPVAPPPPPPPIEPEVGYVEKNKQMFAVEAARKLQQHLLAQKPVAATGAGVKRVHQTYDLASDFTTKEINQMRCIDLINHDRRKMEELNAVVKELRQEITFIPEPPAAKRRTKK